jgi:hypothetical protein
MHKKCDYLAWRAREAAFAVTLSEFLSRVEGGAQHLFDASASMRLDWGNRLAC